MTLLERREAAEFARLYNKYYRNSKALDQEIERLKAWEAEEEDPYCYSMLASELEDLLAVKRAVDFHGGTF